MVRMAGTPRDRPRPVVLLDANVLYSKVLGDYFVRLQETEVVSVMWSTRVLDEVVRNKKEAAAARYSNIKDLLPLLNAADALRSYVLEKHQASFIEPAVEHYDQFDDMSMPDPDDRHVVAAAVAANADYLCTADRDDFPDPVMERIGIERQTPDELLHQFAAETPLAMVEAHQGVIGWTYGRTHRQLLETLRRAQAPLTAERLERLLTSLGDLDSRDDLAQVYVSALAQRDRAQAGLLPPSNRRARTVQPSARPMTDFHDRQRLDQQRGIG